ncbi:MAG: TonB-dependent receptor, partial [Verrucomicrobia bacterium]|nr:TonB-dependent receptor [Verrucomicrobiota bacterium]
MKRNPPVALLFACFALALAGPHTVNAADGRAVGAVARQNGTISGQISNAATGAYLEGARVEMQGTGRQALADREGRYVIVVPEGEVTLVVSYTGLASQSIALTLAGGQALIQNVGLTSDIYQMETLVVEGEREGSALATTRQRQAANVKNVVAGDAFGTATEDNVGSFLQRLPGLNIISDTGLVREVMVRGISSSLNTVEMDGVQMANTNSSGTNRFFDFLQASLSMVESIEVTKAPTPDMPASSIGGSINMVTRTAFSRANPRVFTYSIGLVHKLGRIGGRAEPQKRWYQEPIEGITPSVGFTYSDVMGKNRNLGLSFSFSRNTQFGGSEDALFNYQSTLNRPAYIRNSSIRVAASAGPHTRRNINVKLEYKLSDRTIVSLTAVHNLYHENPQTRTHLFTTGDTAARFAPGYSETYSEALPNVATLSQLTEAAYDNVSNNYRSQIAVVHRLSDMTIDYSATVSQSNGYQYYAPFERNFPGKPKGTLTISGLTNIGWIVDRRRDPAWPIITQTAGRDVYDLNSYTTMTMTQNHNSADSIITEGRFSLKKNIELAVPTYVKTGFQYQQQRRERDNKQHSYTFTGPGGLGQFADKRPWVRETISGQRQGPWADQLYVAQHKEDHPEYWPENISYRYVQRLQSLQDVRESIASGYVMGNVQIQRLGILAGLRVEETETQGNGPVNKAVNPAEAARRAAFVGTLTEAEIIRRANYDWGSRTHAEGKYRNIFPGIHFKYAHGSGLLTRASYSTSIGRPGIASIIPSLTVNETTERVTVNNAGLKPQKSDNFDLSLEYYFEPIGLFSASCFLKEVSSFIFTDSSQIVRAGPDNGYDGLYENYSITTTANGGSARYRGFEVNYQQQFTFLPGFWSGFGLNMNYTQLQTKGDYGGTVATTQVAGFRPRTGNISINYRKGKYEVRLQTNWLDTYLTTTSTNAALLAYEAPRITTNAKFTYTIGRGTSVY